MGQSWPKLEGFKPSKLSPHITEEWVADFERRGFDVIAVETSSTSWENSSELCITTVLARRFMVTILRFFGPMFMLVFTPFVGFFLPVKATMPRVATSFIPFLALQVFAKRAYDMQPDQQFSLTLLDAIMFTVTEILFFSDSECVCSISR